MATISTTLKMEDRVSRVLSSISSGLTSTVNLYQDLENASGKAFDTAEYQQARREIANINDEIANFDDELKKAAEEQDNFKKKTQQSDNAMDKLVQNVKKLAKIGAVVIVVKKVYEGVKKGAEFVDNQAMNKARLNLINDGLQSTKSLQYDIYKAALNSRTVYDDMLKNVSQLKMLTGDVFKSNKQATKFSELMAKQFKIGGASAETQKNAMLQLTQAMSSGILQGDEFRSLRENAPLLIQAIADVMDVSKAELKDLASEGAITADIIKEAMFTSADDINRKFSELPHTFADYGNAMKSAFQKAMEPVSDKIIEMLGANDYEEFISQMEAVFDRVADGTIVALEALERFGAWFESHQSTITIAFWTIAFASLGMGNMVATAIFGIIGILFGFQVATKGMATAWEIMKKRVKQVISALKIIFLGFVAGFKLIGQEIALGLIDWVFGFGEMAKTVASIIMNLVNKVLYKVQGLVNGVIDLINFLIKAGKSVGLFIGVKGNIEHATFADDAAAKMLEYYNELADTVDGAKASAESAIKDFFDIKGTTDKMDTELENIKNINEQVNNTGQNTTPTTWFDPDNPTAAEPQFTDPANIPILDDTVTDDIVNNTGRGADNTGAMKDSMDQSTEELKWLRDAAEQEAINRFTTAEIKIEMNNQNNINSDTDIDGIVAALSEEVEKAMEASANGVYV